MTKKIILILCVIFLFNLSCDEKNEKVGETNVLPLANDSLPADIDKYITPYIDSGFVGVVLIADSNNIILNRAYGKSLSKPDSNASFWIASNTKPITAIAILKLNEDGLISIKDSITKFFKDVPVDKKNITIEQLLTHTSGLPSNFICEGEKNMESAIKDILSQKLISLPGKKLNYTNDGYILLAAIVELSSKSKYESYIRKNIFNKIGMMNSNFWGEEVIQVDQINDSARYKPFYNKIFKNRKPLENWNNKGAAGICSNTIDLYKMVAALKKKKILNQKSLDEMFSPKIEVDINNDTILSYGYGWALLNYKKQSIEIRHRGRGDYMHNNSICLLPNGYTIIAWSRDTGPNNPNWSTEVCKRLIRRFNNML
ncbi:MAG: serine hydrolase [bacterium]|nr:serine hydrolase [bacterium]